MQELVDRLEIDSINELEDHLCGDLLGLSVEVSVRILFRSAIRHGRSTAPSAETDHKHEINL